MRESEICGEFFIFQQGNVPTHQARETINFLRRGSVATYLRSGEQCGMVLLQISSRMRWWKNLENRSVFVKVMNKCIVAQFIDSLCIRPISEGLFLYSLRWLRYKGSCSVFLILTNFCVWLQQQLSWQQLFWTHHSFRVAARTRLSSPWLLLCRWSLLCWSLSYWWSLLLSIDDGDVHHSGKSGDLFAA